MKVAGKRVHLMGIGGVGVSALVPLLRQAGATVDGCDLASNRCTQALADDGIAIAVGHDPAHIADHDLVVHTAAVPPDHAELRRAREAGIPVLTRAACLAELLRGRPTIAVAGSHGKTTTTWLCGHLLISHGSDPLVVVGGRLPGLGPTGVHAGDGAWCVIEVDESDGGFSHVDPTIAVVTNLDDEHLDHYGSRADLERAFRSWLERVPADGAVVVADEVPTSMLQGLQAPVIRCGIDRGDYRTTSLRCDGDGSVGRVWIDAGDAGDLRIPLPGRHNVVNALLALAAARRVDDAVCPSNLAAVQRVGRRFTVHGEQAGVRVVEDYAHHPTEILATVAAAALHGGAVHVLFQPHRYSRCRDCFDAFVACFDQTASLALLPIYAAGEEPLPGITARRLSEAVAARLGAERVQYSRQAAAAIAFCCARARPGDSILVLGAGDVGELAPLVVEALQ